MATRWRSAVALVALLAGCGGAGPADAFGAFVRALEHRDWVRAYALLAPDAQAGLVAAAERARVESGGVWTPSPHELLGRARVVRPAKVSVVAEDGSGALLEVRMNDEREHAVEMVRAGDGEPWRVLLLDDESRAR